MTAFSLEISHFVDALSIVFFSKTNAVGCFQDTIIMPADAQKDDVDPAIVEKRQNRFALLQLFFRSDF
jgi:hypothetical protein